MFYRCPECGATYDATKEGDSERRVRIDENCRLTTLLKAVNEGEIWQDSEGTWWVELASDCLSFVEFTAACAAYLKEGEDE